MPFIRLSDNYIDHPKFLALSDGAFRLWHESMAFCRKHQTDGLIPFSTMRGFRYYTKSREKQLATGYIPEAKPLWILVRSVGYTINDYLFWNLSKEEESCERSAATARMRKFRSKQKDGDGDGVRDGVGDASHRESRTPFVPDMDMDRKKLLEKERIVSPPKVRSWQGNGAMGADLPRAHLRHSVCGRVCLQETQFARFVQKFGGTQAEAFTAVETWARGVLDAWSTPPLLEQAIGENDFQFWDARWAEWRSPTTKAPKVTLADDAAAVREILRKQGALS